MVDDSAQATPPKHGWRPFVIANLLFFITFLVALTMQWDLFWTTAPAVFCMGTITPVWRQIASLALWGIVAAVQGVLAPTPSNTGLNNARVWWILAALIVAGVMLKTWWLRLRRRRAQ